MFSYYPAQSIYSSNLSPRDRYLSALAEAKAAEADYLAAEAAQREEEDYLRRRLAQLEYRKRDNFLGSRSALPVPTVPAAYPSYDHLYRVHQQIAEEEERRAEAELAQRRRQDHALRQLEAARIHQAREAAQQRRIKEQKEAAALTALLEQSLQVAEPIYPSRHKALRHPNTSKQVGLRIHPSVRILLGGHEVPVAEKPKVTFNEPSDALTNRNPTDQRVKHCKVFQESEEDFPSKSAPKSSGSVPHEFTLDTLLQEFAKMLVPLATNAKESSTSASASPTKPVADTPAKATPAVTPHVTVQEKPLATNANGSLKQQLEARLNNEYHSEVRDTIQAIFESLRDAEEHHVTTPSNHTASVSSRKGKAKAKESSESANITAPTSKNVVDSFNEVRSIEAAFSALESDFSFPASLDFIASHLIPGTPESSDSESSSISTHLAYTSRNHPIRFYEQALSALLTQLDSIESYGNEELRATRREVVSRVERALEELEKEVEGRFRTKLSKVAKAPVETSEDISAPAPSASPERTVSGPAPVVEPIAEEPSISQDSETVLEPVVVTAAESTVVVPESAVETATDAEAEPSTTSPEVTQAVEAHPSESPDLSPSEPSSPIVLVETSKPDSVIDDHESLSLSSSDATVKPVVIVEEEEVQEMAASDKLESAAFLLTQAELSDQKRPNHKDDDVASDWSEVEA